jgi:hypothetical protein
MERLKNLIKEVLSTPPTKKDCNCGCHSCDNVGNPGVVLNESLVKKDILSENLRYHVDKQLPLTENTFRYGSESFINLWAEARSLYLREIIHVNEDDKEILEETNLGNFGLYEGVKVPLDLPMLEEEVNSGDLNKLNESIYTDPNTGKSYDLQYVSSKNRWELDITKKNSSIYDKVITIKRETVEEIIDWLEGYNIDSSWVKKSLNEENSKYPDFDLDKNIKYQDTSISSGMWRYTGKEQGGTQSTYLGEVSKSKKKDPLIGKPKRSSSGGKAYIVYVRDPKTKKIKTVRFGSGGLKAKINNPKARQAFAARHDCKNKTDKTKASYWSCRLPRYAKLLGLKSSFSGFW